MIHELLHLDKPLFILDIEATSLDVKEARIVELAFQQWDATGMTKEWQTRINPGVPIPTSASKIHGIFDADVAGKPTFKQLAANLAKGLSDCSFANQNIRFDLRVLSAEFARAGVAWNYVGARIVDSSRLEALAVPRHLSDLYRKYKGDDLKNAHGAMADVRAAAEVIAAQLQRYVGLPRDLDALHAAQWPGFLCDGGQFKMIDGVATCCFGKKWNGRAMKDIDQSYWDWILGADFPADVKALAAEAKMGKFPK